MPLFIGMITTLLMLGATRVNADDTVTGMQAVSLPDIAGHDVLFLFIGAVMVFSMHAGFAFLELGTVRRKNQVNALQKIITDWGISTVIYFFIGYPVARGVSFMVGADTLYGQHGLQLITFFFYLTFAACIPAIISGGIAERAKFWPIILANAFLVGAIYPLFESLIWWRYAFNAAGNPIGLQKLFVNLCGGTFTDFAGSVVVHSFGGWLALPAIILLGPRLKRYTNGAPPISNIPFLVLGSWILCIGWFGFNVVSAAQFNGASGLVAVNSLMAMVGGLLASVLISKNDAGFTHNGALAGLIAVCAGSAVVHPIAAFVIGAIGGLIFYFMFTVETERFKIDDVLGVWPLHGIVGSWGGIAAGIFGSVELFGARENINFFAQVAGTFTAIIVALVAGFIIFGVIKLVFGLRMEPHDEMIGADRAIHNIEAYPEESI
ncbi:MAG: ammonium transporter [Victivallaceae bacterium]|nr:ammonium transporter [Victivallaceae bacterium]